MIKKTPQLMASLLKIYDEIADSNNQTICFTSSIAKEGTTTIALAIAEAAVSLNKKVLYCDFSEYSTSLSKRLNTKFLPSEKTCTRQIYENIQFIKSSGFSLIPSPIPAEQTLQQKAVINELFDELKKDYDLIIIDCNYYDSFQEGILPTRNLILAADSTIVIALTGGISEARVKQTVDKIVHERGSLLGIVLNDVNYPKLVDELCEQTHSLESIFPKTANDLRQWLRGSDFLNTEI